MLAWGSSRTTCELVSCHSVLCPARQAGQGAFARCLLQPDSAEKHECYAGSSQQWASAKGSTAATVLGMPININTLRLPAAGGQGFSAVQQSMLEALKLTPPQQFKDWDVRPLLCSALSSGRQPRQVTARLHLGSAYHIRPLHAASSCV